MDFDLEVAVIRGGRGDHDAASGPMTLVGAAGEIDIMTAPKLRAHLDVAFGRRRPVVLDLEQVTFIDASGIRVLVDAQRRAAKWGTTFEVRAPSPVVTRVLDITGLADVIHVERARPGWRPVANSGSPAVHADQRRGSADEAISA